MNQTPVKLGPLALLLTVISICLTVLSILTFTTARADQRLAEKYASTVRERYELEAEGQAWLRDLVNDAEGVTFEADLEADSDHGPFQHRIEKNDSILIIRFLLKPEEGVEARILGWKLRHGWEEDTSMGDLWMPE